MFLFCVEFKQSLSIICEKASWLLRKYQNILLLNQDFASMVFQNSNKDIANYMLYKL
jgi:hypothetical protein